MAKTVYIFTDESDINANDDKILDEIINTEYDDKTFIISEDSSQSLLANDSGDALMVMEYVS